MELWVAGARVVLAGSDWRFFGVYTSKDKALGAFETDPRIRWVAPVETDAAVGLLGAPGAIDWTRMVYVDERPAKT